MGAVSHGAEVRGGADPAAVRLVVVSTPELVWGFRLAGVHAVAATTPDEAAAEVERLAGEGGTGIIAVHGPFLDALAPADRRRLEAAVPALVRLPAGRRAEPAEARRARLAELLGEAVGYHITFPGTGS